MTNDSIQLKHAGAGTSIVMFHHWAIVGSISLNHCAGCVFEEWQQQSQVRTLRSSQLLLRLAQGLMLGKKQHLEMLNVNFTTLKCSRCHQTPALADDSGIKCSSSPELSTEACYWGGQLHPYSSIMIKAGCVALLASTATPKDLCCCSVRLFSTVDRTSHS